MPRTRTQVLPGARSSCGHGPKPGGKHGNGSTRNAQRSQREIELLRAGDARQQALTRDITETGKRQPWVMEDPAEWRDFFRKVFGRDMPRNAGHEARLHQVNAAELLTPDMWTNGPDGTSYLNGFDAAALAAERDGVLVPAPVPAAVSPAERRRSASAGGARGNAGTEGQQGRRRGCRGQGRECGSAHTARGSRQYGPGRTAPRRGVRSCKDS